MAERKCSVCQEPGHTKRTCTTGETVSEPKTIVGMAAEYAEVYPKGRWTGATRSGRCTWCGDPYFEGASIRADGNGGWECRCVQGEKDEDGLLVPDPAWVKPTAANVQLPPGLNRMKLAEPAPLIGRNVGPVSDPSLSVGAQAEPDPFSSPAPVSGDAFSGPAAVDGDEPRESKTERLGYICKDPVLGDFRRYKNGNKKGITRATTFNKAATNSKAITDWNKRNIIVGGSRRPDIMAKAHGLDVNLDNAALMDIADQLEDAAGGNVASAMGTDVHSWTERVDSGDAKLNDVPPQYRQAVTLYVGLLRDHGLHIVPELRERTTYIKEFGGVAGTFDAILYHERSGTYRISDTKTGKSMDNGWPEIECQSWIYQHGYNEFGTYNWETHEWEAPQHYVSGDFGVVIHLPVAGPLAGSGRLKMTDLNAGREHAELCALVRAGGKSKARDWVEPTVDWQHVFSSVTSNEQAGKRWAEAKAAGVDRMELQLLVATAQSALRSLGVHS
jgi:hypothetical protein